MRRKKVVIEALLVHESSEEKPEKVKQDILREFSEGHIVIPWLERIDRIRIID
jgi:hypothetical protein